MKNLVQLLPNPSQLQPNTCWIRLLNLGASAAYTLRNSTPQTYLSYVEMEVC